jgi:DNA replication protein DnaC
MTPPPRHIPTQAFHDLEAEVARRRARLEQAGHANELERHASIIGDDGRIVSVADVARDAAAMFERLRQKKAAFDERLRPQFNAAPQSIACEFHPQQTRPISFDRTAGETQMRGVFTPIYEPCALCEAEERAARQRRYWLARGVEERNITASFRSFIADTPEKSAALATVKAWLARRGNYLLLIGPTGTGKGHLATACLRANGSGIFVKHPDLLGQLRATYSPHSSHALSTHNHAGASTAGCNTEDLIRRWQDCEMLVLDEFGLTPGGRDEEPVLYRILADRYDRRRPTIITTNLELAPLREALGFRLLDRIRPDCTQVEMAWESWRGRGGEGSNQ